MRLDKSPREQGQRQPGVSYTSEAAALAVSCSRLKAAACRGVRCDKLPGFPFLCISYNLNSSSYFNRL